ncbi:twin-arginine translocation signal domain-containing protein [Flavitalea flava]
MENNQVNQPSTDRRGFLGTLAAGAAAFGVATLASPASLLAETGPLSGSPHEVLADADEWFKQIKGKHRMVFDSTGPKDIFPFAWPKVFLLTNMGTGTAEKDCSVVVVLRHEAIPFAMENRLWEKYKFGETFKIQDPLTKSPAIHNPFWMPKPGDYKVPGIGNVAIGINELQDSGVLFCVCDMALTVYSNVVGGGMNLDPQEVKKDWLSGLLPNIPPMPSGVWAVGRAQEHGCAYCFAG